MLYREKYYLPWRPITGNSESAHALEFSVSYYVTMVGPGVLREELLNRRAEPSFTDSRF